MTDEKPNSWEQITTYNNYYEFGADKDSPAIYANTLKTEPWKVVVEGECAKPRLYALEDILKGQTLEDRIYRLSMRRALVDGDSVGRVLLRELHQAVRADVQGQIRRVLHAERFHADARRTHPRAALAVSRGAPHGSRRCIR